MTASFDDVLANVAPVVASCSYRLLAVVFSRFYPLLAKVGKKDYSGGSNPPRSCKRIAIVSSPSKRS
jgi:hypothetical protein